LQQRFSVELCEATAAAAVASQHLIEKKQKTKKKSHSRQLLNFNKIEINKMTYQGEVIQFLL
jgi:hypothetical protein